MRGLRRERQPSERGAQAVCARACRRGRVEVEDAETRRRRRASNDGIVERRIGLVAMRPMRVRDVLREGVEEGADVAAVAVLTDMVGDRLAKNSEEVLRSFGNVALVDRTRTRP